LKKSARGLADAGAADKPPTSTKLAKYNRK
jgi:hypothetical protein